MNAAATTTPGAGSLMIHPQYGAALQGRWVPAPRYLLRRDRILATIGDLPPGRVVEVGCGAGALLRDFAVRGHICRGLESSEAAVRMAREILADFPACEVSGETGSDWDGTFDVLVSCEVLEHIEDDRGALTEWVRWVRPGGRVILSVPAHMSMWGPHDVWAGHVRRYDKDGFVRLAEAVGLVVERVECYGFPLINLTHVLRNLAVRRNGRAGGAGDQSAATAASGIDRSADVKLFKYQTSFVGCRIMATACRLQRLFLSTDWGEGYLLVASRPAS